MCLDTPDTYPPQKKVFLMWKYLYENFRTEYNWYALSAPPAPKPANEINDEISPS